MRLLVLLSGALAAATVGVAAGGGTAPRGYTRSQLAIMVLPKSTLGSEANGLDVDLGSGFTDNAAAADTTLDPNDSGRQLARSGRIVGYELTYSDLSSVPFARGSGLLSLASSVDLFKSARSADAFITKQLRDARKFSGKRVDFGVSLLASSTFRVSRLGDRAVGLRTIGELGSKRFYGTLAGFRVGRLVAAVEVDRADGKEVGAQAERLAHALAARIRLAAADKLKTQRVPVPQLGRKGHRPVGGPDLAPMALSLSDLPKGAKVARQGYVGDRDSIGHYDRAFDTSPARFGGSTLSSLESDVSLLRSAKEASGFFLVLRAIYNAHGIERDLTTAFGKGAGTTVGPVTIEQRPSIPAGDESVTLVARVTLAGTPLRVAFVNLRIDRVIGILIVAGRASMFHFSDVRPLVDTFAKRIKEGL